MDSRSLPTARNPLQVSIASADLIAQAAPEHSMWLVSLDTDAAALGLAPGDTIGVVPPALTGHVAGMLAALGLAADAPAPGNASDQRVGEWLSGRELSIPPAKLLRLAGLSPAPGPYSALPPQPDVLDVIGQIEDAALRSDEILATLRPAAPRAFSVASSPRATGTLDLVVGHHPIERGGRARAGVASTLLVGGSRAAIFPIPNPQFRLPAGDEDMLLIATGTGFGPFRAFLRERALAGATGRAWVVYGERGGPGDRRSSFSDEFSAALSAGVATRVDVAMSTREDGPRYVQEILQDQGDEVAEWLEGGARVYACGNAGMVESIEGTLAQVIADELGISAGEAAAQVANWRESDRLALDAFA